MLNTLQGQTALELGKLAAYATKNRPGPDMTIEIATYQGTLVTSLTAMDESQRSEFVDRVIEHAIAARDAGIERRAAAAQS